MARSSKRSFGTSGPTIDAEWRPISEAEASRAPPPAASRAPSPVVVEPRPVPRRPRASATGDVVAACPGCGREAALVKLSVNVFEVGLCPRCHAIGRLGTAIISNLMR